jgi:GntR family transcriptional regulator
MHLRLEPTSGVPLGLQIAQGIRLAVASGRLAPGERLPSARDLAAELSVNFHTVRRAYQDLEREGLLFRERGVGTFVVERTARLDQADLRRLVRAHLERLAGDLAGSEIALEEILPVIERELARLFPQEVKR